MKYKTCPHCGNHLDFGEKCDCQHHARSSVFPGRAHTEDARAYGAGADMKGGDDSMSLSRNKKPPAGLALQRAARER